MKNFILNCLVCQKYKSKTIATAGFLSSSPIPNVVSQDIAMDFIVGLPKIYRKNMVLVVVDHLSKFCSLHPNESSSVSNSSGKTFL